MQDGDLSSMGLLSSQKLGEKNWFEKTEEL